MEQAEQLIAGVVWPTHKTYQVILLSDQYWIVKTPGNFGAAELKLGRTTENELSFDNPILIRESQITCHG